jgi:hypothetical protein
MQYIDLEISREYLFRLCLFTYNFSLIFCFEKESRLMRSRCVCVCVSVSPLIVARHWLGKNPLIVARQRLCRNVTGVKNTHATIEELLDASFSMWPVSYQGK